MTSTKRRTQKERSTQTRKRLIEATLDCLYEEGAARATTNMIAARAGMSRGALTHHYASKEDLITDSMEYLLQSATDDIRALGVQLREGEISLDGVLDELCAMFQERLMLLTLEHVTEARHNEHLHSKMVQVVHVFHRELDAIWREFFHTGDVTDQEVETTLNMTLCLFRGMGVQSVLRKDPPYYKRLREAWKRQLHTILDHDDDLSTASIHHFTRQGVKEMSFGDMTRRGALATLGASGLLLASGLKFKAQAAGSPVMVGALNPVSGAGGTYGPGMQKSILFAAEEVNAAGGAAGHKIKVVAEDTQTSPESAVNAAKKLIDVNKVGCVLGTWSSGVTLAVMPITTAAGVPLMCTSGAPKISVLDKADLVWRYQATNDRFGRAFAKIAKARRFKRPAGMAYNNASGIGNVDGFAKAWPGKLVARVIYEPKRPAYRSELQKVMAANPDVIVMGSYLPDTTIILREWYQMGGKNAWIIPGWAANPKLVDTLGLKVTEGIISVDSISNEGAASYANFSKMYEKATGKPGSTNVYAAMAYDMMIVWALAMEAAGPGADSAAVNAKIRDIGNPGGKEVFSFAEGAAELKKGGKINYQGASSKLDFDKYGDVTPDFAENVITDGKFVRKSIVKI